MAPVMIGLIGFGRIAGLFHLRALSQLVGVRVSAVAEPDLARRQEAISQVPGAIGYADYRDLLEQSDVDAVVICTPPAVHAEMAIAAFRAGRHVYLEKPIATTLSDADTVLDAWRTAGTVGMAGFNFRFHPLYQAARRRLADGALGSPLGARTVFTTSARPLPDWKRSRENGGGVLLDLASHHIDLARHLFESEVDSAQAEVISQRTEGDTASLQLRLKSGVLVQSLVSMTSVDDHRFEIYGSEGKLVIDRSDPLESEIITPQMKRGIVYRVGRAAVGFHPRRVLRSSGYEPSFATALEVFARATGGETLPDHAPTIEDGWRSLATVIAAEESACSGRFIRPMEPSSGSEPVRDVAPASDLP